ncbi:nitroreductase family protein [Parasphaerochaeta coccoides]|uniref:Nitroreductase n=1 Tax=Parasphaerochaeta coccoides (strain ATCC BAA-1237 / DSM 17374 / SPN1) TaxID=760011 RepID=F4GKB9_PARC1|nr:nitroreductase family protein [Parasphaerochaeta coccoides]AEC02315.1 nitroreductase [Parasphaerochaeta coccoides DSM 17374]
MNPIIRQLKAHRTFRDFDPSFTVSDEQLQSILDATCQAPSSMNGQHYSIIVVDDSEKKQRLAELIPSNAKHIIASSVFLLFVADLRRMHRVCEHYGTEFVPVGKPEPLLISTIDTALAVENAVVAVESLGLGSVIVGSIRSVGDKIITMFNMPEYTLPLLGLSIGKPAVEMRVKPRLPKDTVVHRNAWKEFDYRFIEEYDGTMEKFAEARETKLWSIKFRDYYSQESSPVTRTVLEKQKI